VDGRPPALILLHGRGADEEDLLGLSEYLDDRLFIVSPRAPFSFAMGGGHTWYDLVEIGNPDDAMFTESFDKLVTFVRDVREGYALDPAKIFFLGFSMGSVMAVSLALTHPELASGVLANSGYLAEHSGLEYRWNEIRGKPFFIAHGLYDPVIPYSYGRRVKEMLETHGAGVTYREYDMGHQINEESLSDMIAWLTPRLG
jgi:phospholipase/carboxylesterase